MFWENKTKKYQEVFQDIKDVICSDRVLTYYDPKLPIFLASDASPVSLGAVLSHRFFDCSKKPAFASKAFSSAKGC